MVEEKQNEGKVEGSNFLELITFHYFYFPSKHASLNPRSKNSPNFYVLFALKKYKKSETNVLSLA